MAHPIDRRRWLIGSAGLLTTLAGCGGGVDDDVRLRAVNATEDLDAIDVDYNEWNFAYDVRQGGDATAYDERKVLVVGAFGWFEVFRARDSLRLYTASHSLPDADSASVVVFGGRDRGIGLRLLDEDAAGPADGSQVRLRVMHALPDRGAIDVHFTALDAPLAGRPADWSLEGYEDLTVFVDRPTGASGRRLRLTRRGDPSSVLFDNRAFDLAGGRAGTLVLAPAAERGRIAVTALPHGAVARRFADGG